MRMSLNKSVIVRILKNIYIYISNSQRCMWTIQYIMWSSWFFFQAAPPLRMSLRAACFQHIEPLSKLCGFPGSSDTLVPTNVYRPLDYYKFLVSELTWQENASQVFVFRGFSHLCFYLWFSNLTGTRCGRPLAPRRQRWWSIESRPCAVIV